MMGAFNNFVAWGLAQPDAKPVAAVPRFSAGSRTAQVRTLLLNDGDKTCQEMAEAIGVTPSAIRQVITSMLKKNLIVSPGERNKSKTWRMA
jgi:predicted ArsR family transcriptional regulator